MTYREMLEAIALSDRETAETAEITNRAMRGLEPFATIRRTGRSSAACSGHRQGPGLERAFENSIKRLAPVHRSLPDPPSTLQIPQPT
jgi:hypothetical protein